MPISQNLYKVYYIDPTVQHVITIDETPTHQNSEMADCQP